MHIQEENKCSDLLKKNKYKISNERSGIVFWYKLRCTSTNQKPTIYRNLYENTGSEQILHVCGFYNCYHFMNCIQNIQLVVYVNVTRALKGCLYSLLTVDWLFSRGGFNPISLLRGYLVTHVQGLCTPVSLPTLNNAL